jgi:hypothetical protein
MVLYDKFKAELLEVERKCRRDEVIWGKILRIFFSHFLINCDQELGTGCKCDDQSTTADMENKAN